jgi:hypothetical protein
MFCSDYLNGYTVNGIELSSTPGIVDIFIWSFSAKDRHSMCTVNPNCGKCKLKNALIYAMIQREKYHSLNPNLVNKLKILLF